MTYYKTLPPAPLPLQMSTVSTCVKKKEDKRSHRSKKVLIFSRQSQTSFE